MLLHDESWLLKVTPPTLVDPAGGEIRKWNLNDTNLLDVKELSVIVYWF